MRNGKLIPWTEIARRVPETRLLDLGGQRIHVEQHGDGDPVLLLHGFAASTYAFRDLIPHLAPRFRVIAMDWNGFGYTERPRRADAYSPPGQVTMIRRTLDTLQVGPCHVLGHSLGGLLALLLAVNAPDRVRSLTLVSPITRLDAPPWFVRLAVRTGLAYALVRVLLASPTAYKTVTARAYHQRDRLTDEVAEAHRERLLVEGLRAAFRGFTNGSTGAGFEVPLERVRAPALVVAGRHDGIVDLDSCRRIADGLADARLRVLEHSGHCAPEEEPAALASAMLELWAAIGAPLPPG